MVNEAKVYVDMDGVICDFTGAVRKLGPIPEQGLAEDATQEQKQAMYDAIEEAGESFWAGMKWTENGKKLWKMLKSYKPVLLSSPGKFLYAPAAKKKWIDKHIPGVTLFLEEDKWIFVESNAILIDDKESNIRDWNEAGGLGILYENDPEATKEELEKIMKEEMLHKQGKVLFEIDKDSIVKSGDNEYFYCCTIPPHPAGMILKDRNKRYVYLHRALKELELGRYLKDDEEVHHKDNNRRNNKPNNLELVKFKKHQKEHSHETKFWKESPRNKPGRKAVHRVLSKHSQSQLRLEPGRIVMESVAEFIRKWATVLLATGFENVVRQTWNAPEVAKNFNKLKPELELVIKRRFKNPDQMDMEDIQDLQQDVDKGTEGKVEVFLDPKDKQLKVLEKKKFPVRPSA